MTDDTLTARRELLAVLLSRAERGALLEAERPLLRLLVGAEVMTADRADGWETRCIAADQARAGAVRRARDAEAAVTRVRELHRKANNGETCVYCAGMQRLGYDTTWPCDTVAALDGPSATRDEDEQTSVDASDVEIVHANDVPTDWARGTELRCPARYTGPPPPGAGANWGPVADYRCELRVRSRGTDHAVRLNHGPFSWTDDIALWPGDGAGQAMWRGPIEGYGTGQPLGILGTLRDGEPIDVKQWGPGDPPNPPLGEGVQRCSPLVNAQCPGHTAPPYCDRAAYSPVAMAPAPDWERLAEADAAVAPDPGDATETFADAPQPCNATVYVLDGTDAVIPCQGLAGHEGMHWRQDADLGEMDRWSDEYGGATPHADAPSEQQ